MTNPKKLSVETVKTVVEQAGVMTPFIIKDINGEEWEISIDTALTPYKAKALSDHMILITGGLVAEQKNLPEEEKVDIEKFWQALFTLEVLIFYTDIDFSMLDDIETETLEEKLSLEMAFLYDLDNLGLLDQIMNKFEGDKMANLLMTYKDSIVAWLEKQKSSTVVKEVE